MLRLRISLCSAAAALLVLLAPALLGTPASARASRPGSVMTTKEEGSAFLQANMRKEGVVTLPSGLQYKALRKGDGRFHPAKHSDTQCHYKGTLIDGTKFDSSYDRGEPTTFAPYQVIRGWTEAMQLMVEGDHWQLFIPPELAYGAGGIPGVIPGGSTLLFELEMIKIKGEKVPAAREV